jgi:acetolactate synthase I/II/III large subunit
LLDYFWDSTLKLKKRKMMKKLSHYLFDYLAEYGVRHVFMVSGGGAMHLCDSVGRNKDIKYICTHHEQAAALAAEGYVRAGNKLGVALVTSGPGGTNTMTGVISSWLDSVPVLFISGQVKRETTIAHYPDLGLRQIGDQEINIIDIVKPVTKYAVSVDNPSTIRFHLEKALYLARNGRPGPVWIDVPLDVQASMIDENSLNAFTTDEAAAGEHTNSWDNEAVKTQIRSLVSKIRESKRPALILGQGIRISGATAEILELLQLLHVPALTTFCGFDLLPSAHPLFAGRPGTLGNRAGNFVMQNADLLICIGTRNNVRQVGYSWETTGRAAYKVSVDIDKAELQKPTFKPDLPIHSDAKFFIEELIGALRSSPIANENKHWVEWRKWCREKSTAFPVVLPEYRKPVDKNQVNPYFFVERLTENLKERATMVTGNGAACVMSYQAGVVKHNQRIFWNSGCASMGYDLPAAIGACIGTNQQPVVCLAGDGSLMMNIQELQTVVHYKLPVKLFIMNNSGYLSIKMTQGAFFNGFHVGCDGASGVSFPDFTKLAKAYGMESMIIDSHDAMDLNIQEALESNAPVLIDVRVSPDQRFIPKSSSKSLPDGRIISKPLEDMFPFLDDKEFRENMIIDVLEEQ